MTDREMSAVDGSNRGAGPATATDERVLSLADREIRDDGDCFVIAEIGHNHQGSLKQAIELFEKAAECGVDAIKLQKRDNRSLYTTSTTTARTTTRTASARRYGEHREVLEFGKEEYLELQGWPRISGWC